MGWARILTGTNADRPTAGPNGLMYLDSDHETISRWSGSAWSDVGHDWIAHGEYKDTNTGDRFSYVTFQSQPDYIKQRLVGYIKDESGSSNVLNIEIADIVTPDSRMLGVTASGAIEYYDMNLLRTIDIKADSYVEFDLSFTYTGDGVFISGHITFLYDRLRVFIGGYFGSNQVNNSKIEINTVGNATGKIRNFYMKNIF